MEQGPVALGRFKEADSSVEQVLSLSGGLDGLVPGDRIVIKPNLIEWDLDLPFAPWGGVTTSAVVGALVRSLVSRGMGKIAIVEGTPLPYARDKGQKVFEALGYGGLRDRYGVELVDLDEEPFEDVDLGGLTLSISERVLAADKIITVPALKTHGICRVSLGIKNLKGCISKTSKRFCHRSELDLNRTFPLLMKKLPVALNLIDGVFALERGPTSSGRAYRRDVLVASRDILGADLVGARLLGYGMDEVPHLEYWADATGRRGGLEEIQVVGDRVADHEKTLQWDTPWREDNSGPVVFDKQGIDSLSFPKPDHTLCTSCTGVIPPALVMLMSAWKEGDSPSMQVLTGKEMLADEGFEKTVLLGKCMSARNRDNAAINKKIEFKTCPPDIHEFERVMREEGLECDYGVYQAFREHAVKRYKEADGFSVSFYSDAGGGA